MATQVKKLLRELESVGDVEQSELEDLQSKLDDQVYVVFVCVCAFARGAACAIGRLVSVTDVTLSCH